MNNGLGTAAKVMLVVGPLIGAAIGYSAREPEPLPPPPPPPQPVVCDCRCKCEVDCPEPPLVPHDWQD